MRLAPRSEVAPAEWERFVDIHPNGWMLHRGAWLDYSLAAKPGAIDRSLACVGPDGNVVGLVPLVQEGDALIVGGEPGGWPLEIPLGDIQPLTAGWGVARARFRTWPGSDQEEPGPFRTAWETVVVDLAKSEQRLWANVRGSYHAIVNRLARDSEFVVRSVDAETFLDEARPLHALAAGRETRPLASWEKQAEWVARGYARCYLAARSGHAVGFAFVVADKAWAYYFSGASIERDVQHAIQWHAIRSLRAEGVDAYEVGWVGKATTDKGKGVEMFKMGWSRDRRVVRSVEVAL